MTPLRQRLIDDLRIRNYAPRTITTYVAAVARFAKHFQQSPDQLHAQHVRQYQLHLLQQHASWSRFNQTVAALRFFYNVTLQRPNLVTMIPYGKKPKTLPAVLSTDEVARLFDAVTNLRYRLILQTAYAAGLRVSEVVGLHVGDIDAARMVLHIRCAKGHKDRLVPLSALLLQRLRDYWRRYLPQRWLFPGQTPPVPSASARCNASAVRPCVTPASPRRPACTRCGTAMPPICWRAVPTWPRCKNCWGTIN